MKKAALALSLFVASSCFSQDGEFLYESSEVAPGIYMTVGVDPAGGFGGGNLGVMIGDDYVAVVDDGLVPPAPKLVNHIAEIAGRPVDFIVNTHYHGDHTGANAAFAESGAVVFAHDNIRERLLENVQSAGGPGGIPVVTFGEGVTFHLNGIEARVLHIPLAHTDGDAIIYVTETNVIFAGDIMFNNLFPYIDLDGGGTVEGFIAGQERIAAMANAETKIIPGHGSLANLTDLKRNTAMLVDALARVKALVDAGKSEDEVVAANPLAGYAGEYDWAFINAERMTRTIYKDLTTER